MPTQKQTKTPVKLTPEETEALKVGVQSEATGNEYTLEESFDFAKSRRKQWVAPAILTA